MKIASGWYKEGLGQAMGFLVGALVLGTAFPHLLKGLGETLHWNSVVISVSFMSVFGGLPSRSLESTMGGDNYNIWGKISLFYNWQNKTLCHPQPLIDVIS